MSAQHLEADQDPDRIRGELSDSHSPISQAVPEKPRGRHSEPGLQLVEVYGHSTPGRELS